jgi:hypothetical protein
VSGKFNHMFYVRVPKSWMALLEAAAKAQDSNPGQYAREALAVSLAQDGFSTTAQQEFALVTDNGELVSANARDADVAVVTTWPAPVAGFDWFPIDGPATGHGRPSYRVDGEQVIRTWEA